ncbi:glycosyl transferase [Fulvitalea axinellae]|uniref:Glycosyl transferase n=1 Tax=Fulvitalea axinellae TaxID=1182444 RepID=A0AAU9DBH6_9BACT|nr:glycosyl transferase [Fulvitalea axinellae]
MKISIITVTYNNVKTLADTIDSVLQQDYVSLEYIIVDGGSTDGTVELVRDYGDKISKFVSEPDNGMYDAINKGIELSSGEYVGLVHSDDFLAYPQCVSDIVNILKDSQTDSLYADLEYVDAENTEKVVRNWNSGPYSKKRFLWGWMPPHPTFFIKKDLVKKYGGYRLDFGSAADYEFMLRYLYRFEVSASYLSKVTMKMRNGGMSNVSLKNRIKANNSDHRAWMVNNLKPYFFTRYLKPLSKVAQWIG